jgi:hypothetical protein
MLAGEVYDLLGYRARIHAPTPEIGRALRAILKGFGPVQPESEAPLPRYDLTASNGYWRVSRDDTSLQIDFTLDGAIGLVEWHFVAAALAHRRDLVHLHAAALANPSRTGAILLIGKSGSGKTTLTLGLATRGFAPFCDDVTLLDPVSLSPQPLRRAFHVSEETRQLVEPFSGKPLARDPDAPGDYFHPSLWAEVPLPVRWIVLLERKDAAPVLVPLPGAQAAATILGSSSTLPTSTRLALSTCARLTERALCSRLFSGDLGHSLDVLQNLVT